MQVFGRAPGPFFGEVHGGQAADNLLAVGQCRALQEEGAQKQGALLDILNVRVHDYSTSSGLAM